MRHERVEEKRIGGWKRKKKESERSRKGQCRETKERKKDRRRETCGGE